MIGLFNLSGCRGDLADRLSDPVVGAVFGLMFGLVPCAIAWWTGREEQRKRLDAWRYDQNATAPKPPSLFGGLWWIPLITTLILVVVLVLLAGDSLTPETFETMAVIAPAVCFIMGLIAIVGIRSFGHTSGWRAYVRETRGSQKKAE